MNWKQILGADAYSSDGYWIARGAHDWVLSKDGERLGLYHTREAAQQAAEIHQLRRGSYEPE